MIRDPLNNPEQAIKDQRQITYLIALHKDFKKRLLNYAESYLFFDLRDIKKDKRNLIQVGFSEEILKNLLHKSQESIKNDQNLEAQEGDPTIDTNSLLGLSLYEVVSKVDGAVSGLEAN